MTIDFHPPSQDLEDQAKFSVKQYSVTLPQIETTYKSHKELLGTESSSVLAIAHLLSRFLQSALSPLSLSSCPPSIASGDLIKQRMNQDFQIVPRNRVQQNTVTGNSLEATLSMGHKMQR